MSDKVRMLYVYQEIHGETQGGQQPSLCVKGRKYMLCVTAGHPVRVLKRPVAEFDALRSVPFDEKGARVPYPVARAVAKYRELGERNGITKNAQHILELATRHNVELGSDEEDMENEETMSSEQPADDSTKVTTEPTTSEEKPVKIRKRKAKATTEAAPKATKAKRVAKANGNGADHHDSTPREGTKRAKAFEMMSEAFKELKPAERKEPPRGFRKELCDKIAKKLGWKTGNAVADYYGQFVRTLDA